MERQTPGIGRRCLASIESLLSYEANSMPYSEFDLIPANRERMQDYGVMETTLSMDDFQTLPSEQQSEQIFKLLALLSPLAGEVCDLKGSIGALVGQIGENDGLHLPPGLLAPTGFTLLLDGRLGQILFSGHIIEHWRDCAPHKPCRVKTESRF